MLHHDNAPFANFAEKVQNAVTAVSQPLYTSDQPPIDFFLLPKVKMLMKKLRPLKNYCKNWRTFQNKDLPAVEMSATKI